MLARTTGLRHVASEDRWHCPCHGSIYNRHGERIAGPAPRPMDLMGLPFDGSGNAVVDTGKITQRAKFEPDQAVQPPA